MSSILNPRWFLKWYSQAYEKRPFIMAGATMMAKAGICDIAAQVIAEPDLSKLDLVRSAKFTAFCVMYVGCFQHAIYNIIYPRMFPQKGMVSAIKASLFDNFVHTPFIYLPVYYMFKNSIAGGTVGDGLTEYRTEGFDVMTACWGVWIPAQTLNFWIVPPNFRIMFIAGAGTLWEIILSYMAPMMEEGEETKDAQQNMEHGAFSSSAQSSGSAVAVSSVTTGNTVPQGYSATETKKSLVQRITRRADCENQVPCSKELTSCCEVKK